MKTKIEVQFQERNVDVKDTEKLVKEDLKASGVKMNTIANLDIYYQLRKVISITLQQQKTAKRSVTKKH
mgnify:CR=1 FL=1